MSTPGVFDNTVNLNFNLIEFDFASWHDLDYANWRTLDAYLGTYIGINGVQGPWANGTAYTVGQRVADQVNGKIYQCEVAHTSAASPDTFAEDRTANPTYWSELSLRPVLRGEWAASTHYNAGDFVFTNNSLIYAVALTTHTSGSTFAGDSARWSNIIDGTAVKTLETNASNSASAASTSATNAASSASAASTSASNAASSASAASSSATSASGSATTATTQATNAAGSATSASNSAAAAGNSASAAATSATAASNAQTGAETAQTAAVAARDLSQEWATKPEDQAITGSPGQFSALHWAAKAAASAGGNVDSVNGQTGVVVLDAGDVGAPSLTATANTFTFSGWNVLTVNSDGSGNFGSVLQLTENSSQFGFEFRYITNSNLFSFRNFDTGGNVTVFDISRGSAVIDFKGTPTVNGTAVTLAGHTHTIANVTGLQAALDAKATLAVDTTVFGTTNNTTVESRSGANDDADVRVTEAGTTGHRFRHDGGTNRLFLENTSNSFGADVDVFSNTVGSAVVDFKATPTVNGTAVTLAGHTHTIANVTGLQTALDGKATLNAASNVFTNATNVLMELRCGAINNDAEIRLMESSTLGHRLIYDGGTNEFQLQSSANGFSSVTTAFSNQRASTIVDFKGTPTVNGTAVSLTNHTHSNATTGAAGFMSAADKTKLDDLPPQQPVFAQGWRNTTLSIGNNSLIDVTWDSEDDPNNILNGGTGLFTAPTGARFCIASVSIAWASNNTGIRFVELMHGTSARARTRVDPAGPLGEAECSLSAGPFPVTAGDTVFVRVLQNSGGNLNLQAASYNTMAVGFFF